MYQDYYATIYSAEIVNTLTNLLFIALAVKGVLNCVQHGHDRIFLITFVGYGLVGTGSFLFHSTLKCKPAVKSGNSEHDLTVLRSHAARG